MRILRLAFRIHHGNVRLRFSQCEIGLHRAIEVEPDGNLRRRTLNLFADHPLYDVEAPFPRRPPAPPQRSAMLGQWVTLLKVRLAHCALSQRVGPQLWDETVHATGYRVPCKRRLQHDRHTRAPSLRRHDSQPRRDVETDLAA